MNILLAINKTFVPILLVLLALYLLLLKVHFEANDITTEVTHIEIPAAHASDSSEQQDIDDENEHGILQNESYRLGLALISEKDFDAANKVITQLSAAGEPLLAELLTGRMAMEQRDFASALQLFNEIVERGEANVSVYMARARTLNRLQQRHKAIQDYEQIIALSPNHFGATFNRALILLNLDDYEQATAGFKRATTLGASQRRARAYARLASTLVKLDRIEEAEIAVHRSLRFAPGMISARMTLAGIYLKRGDTEQALVEYDRVQRLGPERASVYATLARVYLKHQRYQSAEKMFNSAILHRPDSIRLRMDFAEMLDGLKRRAEAAAQYHQIVLLDPENIDALFQLGRIYSIKNDYPLSLQYYKRVLALRDNHSPQTWFNIGLVHSAQQHFALALDAFKIAVEQDPQYEQAWNNAAEVHIEMQQLELAQNALQQAISANSAYSPAWFSLGVVYTKNNEIDNAIDALQKAIDIRPGFFSAKRKLAGLFVELEDYESAENLYRKILDTQPHRIRIWHALGLTLSEQGKTSDAIQAFEKAIDLDDRYFRSFTQLGRIFYRQEEYDKAKDYLNKTLDIRPENTKARYLLAKTYFRQNNYTDALHAANQVLALRPESRNAKRLINRIEKKMNAQPPQAQAQSRNNFIGFLNRTHK